MTARTLVVAPFLIVLAGCTWSSDDNQSGELVDRGSDEEKPQQLYSPEDVNKPLSEPPKLLSDEQLRDGWIALFDGRTLFGWVANSEADWSVQDGEIVCRDGSPGLLLTTTAFRDYELKCDVWLEPGGNSGLFLRTVTHPDGPTDGCLEFNLSDSHETFPTGSLVGHVEADPKVKIEGGWHTVDLLVQGDRVTASIDGTQVLDASDATFTTTGGGYIGFQQNDGEVRFRNIFLRPHGTDPILDADRLDEWRVTGEAEAEPEEDDAVRLRGTGYLESPATYDDFVLQFEAKLNATDVNSGLFFRTQPSTEEAPSNGYELQLQNTIADGDRTRPADYGDGFGTGAIFRRQAARYVNASDEEWFTVTLVANGNHFASWVNGLQVTDFTDERDPDPNPRRGRRDEAGHLSFQGHDAGTDASFRDVRIAGQTFDESEPRPSGSD